MQGLSSKESSKSLSAYSSEDTCSWAILPPTQSGLITGALFLQLEPVLDRCERPIEISPRAVSSTPSPLEGPVPSTQTYSGLIPGQENSS